MLCYCGSACMFSACCQPYIAGQAIIGNCEQLMRSRYSAYCHHETAYIYNTYHPSVRAANPISAIAKFANSVHFTKLSVLSSEQATSDGYVCFNVMYIQNNLLCEFTERSRFVFDNTWLYQDGVLTDKAPIKIGRNDFCPCNSGKKFKQCFTHQLSGN